MNSFRTGIFDSFNARFLRPEEVGATFVNSPFLSDILSSSNTAVLGPRGSGKTTLLKMLTLPAMLRWQDPARDAVAESLQYLAVYIPASLTWNADYRGFAGQISDQRLSDLISISLFRHGVLFSLLNTWQEAAQSTIGTHDALRRFYLPISEKEEARVVRALAARWELDTPISSVGGLREAVSNRVRVLQTLAVRSSYGGMSFNGLLDKFSFLTKHFFDDCTSFLDVMQAEYDFNQKVALCFDEIEIAPDAIANAIIKMPRSVD
jgi:hypothetical protein